MISILGESTDKHTKHNGITDNLISDQVINSSQRDDNVCSSGTNYKCFSQ